MPSIRQSIYCKKNGFTLIEVLLYSALLAFFLVSAIFIVNQVLEDNRTNKIQLNIVDESEFIMNKIKYDITTALSTITPTSNATGTILSLNKFNYANNPVTFSLSGEDLFIQRGSDDAVKLNSDKVQIKSFMITHSRDELSEYSIIKIELSAQNIKEDDNSVYEASTTLISSYKI